MNSGPGSQRLYNINQKLNTDSRIMESTTKGSGRSQPKSLSTTAEMALVGRSFAITGRLQKVGKNGSSRLALKNFGITIGDIRSPESEIPKSLPAGYAEIEVSNEVIT